MIDLHCHLLPGVDDGPDTLEETLEYALEATRAGTERIVATPHVEQVWVRELPDRVREVREALEREGIELEVDCGGELKPHSIPALDQEELELIAHGPPGARWVLLEVPFRGLGEELLEGAAELRSRGFAVLLAHPERAAGIGGRTRLLHDEVQRGARIQMNVGPLTAAEGPERKRAAARLLAAGLPDALATDAHPPGRPYTLMQGLELARRHGAADEVARRLVSDGPRALLEEGIRFQP